MRRLFVISDHHFYHHNIIGHTNRPFTCVDEMNSFMITKWNETVTPDDIVIHNGDVHLAKVGGRKKGPTKEQAEMLDFDRIQQIISSLNGEKWLIKGNHDLHSDDFYIRCGFARVYIDNIHIFEEWAFSHRPFFETRYQNRKASYKTKKWYHGHIHNQPSPEAVDDLHINVSVEVLEYKPLLISEDEAKIDRMTRTFRVS